ncbi:MAG TPA: penicillin-binding protein 1A [Thermohalobaculum sp.]|nr:penicillin-binding protein 1A [Thermohalobaculum sp.]
MIRFIGTLFGLLSTGAIFAVGGLAALTHIYGQDLPGHDELVNYHPQMLTRVYSGEGRVIAEFYHEKRVFVPVDEIPPLLKNAFISAEDKNFYSHPGIDAVGIGKALARFAMARAAGQPAKLSGASTITQQVMKNFLVGSDRSFERKIKEAILAVRISGALSKDLILELYLNDIFLGQNTYGVVAAAQRYFGKTLEELTPEDAAYLAALPKAPSDLHPVRQRDRAVIRRNYVLEEMAQNGHLSREAAEAAKQQPLKTNIGNESPELLASADRSYFSEEVRRQLIAELGEGELYEGGLTIRATIDSALQELGARALRRELELYDRGRAVYRGPATQIEAIAGGETTDWRELLAAVVIPRDIVGWQAAVVLDLGKSTALVGIEGSEGDGTARLKLAAESAWIKAITRDGEKRGAPKQPADLWQKGDVVFVARPEGSEDWTMRQLPEVQGAFMAMDPFSGRVLAIQGGFSFEASVFNRATQALRQPGSAFKPFVYAAALDAGFTPATVVLDAPVVVRQPGQDDWRPKNSSKNFYGPSPLRLGLELSRNLMTVRIAQAVGMDRVANYAERFGVYENMPHHLSYALGAGETTLYNMVAAYGMFANGGKRVRPTVVDRVQDRSGQTLFRHDPRLCQGCANDYFDAAATPMLFDQRSQIMDPVTAYQLVSMLQGVVQRGTASGTVGDLGFPVAGKTGTTNEARDAWFIGFSPNMVAGCYIGYDNPTPMGRGAYGGTLCGPVFKEFMVEAMKTRAPGEFREPIGARGGMILVKFDRETGERLPDDAIGAHVVTELFQAGTEPALYEVVSAISGDDTLFGGLNVSNLFGINATDLPFDESNSIGAQEQSGETITDTPPIPQPPSGGSIGIGTGGLY